MAFRMVASWEQVPQPRCVAFSDWHLHEWPDQAQVGPGGINTRLLEGIAAGDWVAELALRVEARAVFNTGDTLHTGKTHVSGVVADLGFRAMRRVFSSRPGTWLHVLLAGNHDQPQVDADLAAVRSVAGWPQTALIDRPTVLESKDTGFARRILAVPHIRDPLKLKAAVVALQKPGDLVLAHGQFRGAVVGEERDWFEGEQAADTSMFKVPETGQWIPAAVLSGHIHRAQSIEAGQLRYVGALNHLTFSDSGRVPEVLVFNPDTLDAASVEVPCPRFIKSEVRTAAELRVLVGEVEAQALRPYVWAVLGTGAKLTPHQVATALEGKTGAPARVKDERKAEPVRQLEQPAASLTDRDLLAGYIRKNPPVYPDADKELDMLIELGLGYLEKAG